MGVVLQAEQRWVCPNCPATARTVGQPNRFHDCPALGGLTAPLVLEGTDCRVVAVEREDYVGNEDVRLNAHGRPIMSVVTEYGDGRNDLVVYAPTARAAGES
jgi:hypothetical protein